MSEKIHIGFVSEGAIVSFPNCPYYFMKVGNQHGVFGVVRLLRGVYYNYSDLEKLNFGMYCTVVAKSLDDFYREENE